MLIHVGVFLIFNNAPWSEILLRSHESQRHECGAAIAAVMSVTSELASTETNLLSRRAQRPSGRPDTGGLQLPLPPLHDKNRSRPQRCLFAPALEAPGTRGIWPARCVPCAEAVSSGGGAACPFVTRSAVWSPASPALTWRRSARLWRRPRRRHLRATAWRVNERQILKWLVYRPRGGNFAGRAFGIGPTKAEFYFEIMFYVWFHVIHTFSAIKSRWEQIIIELRQMLHKFGIFQIYQIYHLQIA